MVIKAIKLSYIEALMAKMVSEEENVSLSFHRNTLVIFKLNSLHILDIYLFAAHSQARNRNIDSKQILCRVLASLHWLLLFSGELLLSSGKSLSLVFT